jgi:hypothetical protein
MDVCNCSALVRLKLFARHIQLEPLRAAELTLAVTVSVTVTSHSSSSWQSDAVSLLRENLLGVVSVSCWASCPVTVFSHRLQNNMRPQSVNHIPVTFLFSGEPPSTFFAESWKVGA